MKTREEKRRETNNNDDDEIHLPFRLVRSTTNDKTTNKDEIEKNSNDFYVRSFNENKVKYRHVELTEKLYVQYDDQRSYRRHFCEFLFVKILLSVGSKNSQKKLKCFS